jgi:hypothetical protein
VSLSRELRGLSATANVTLLMRTAVGDHTLENLNGSGLSLSVSESEREIDGVGGGKTRDGVEQTSSVSGDASRMLLHCHDYDFCLLLFVFFCLLPFSQVGISALLETTDEASRDVLCVPANDDGTTHIHIYGFMAWAT